MSRKKFNFHCTYLQELSSIAISSDKLHLNGVIIAKMYLYKRMYAEKDNEMQLRITNGDEEHVEKQTDPP